MFLEIQRNTYKYRDAGIQGLRDTHGCQDTGIHEYRDTRIQSETLRDTGIQEYRLQDYRDTGHSVRDTETFRHSEALRYRDTGIQGPLGIKGMDTLLQKNKDTGIQEYKYTGIQGYREGKGYRDTGIQYLNICTYNIQLTGDIMNIKIYWMPRNKSSIFKQKLPKNDR